MSEEKTYPISEIFTSPQGEGVYTGTLMCFIRLAGCTVGKPFAMERLVSAQAKTVPVFGDWMHNTVLPIYTECCTTYDGRQFACDTDYRVTERLTREEIALRVPEKVMHICITGGEPMMHNLLPLAALFLSKGVMVHIETSGTVPLDRGFDDGQGNHLPTWAERECWITVSPKFGVLDEMLFRANEIKLLVDKDFDVEKLPSIMRNRSLRATVFVQPVNGEHTIDKDNLQRCLDLQLQHPLWRVSTQLHKIWGVR